MTESYDKKDAPLLTLPGHSACGCTATRGGCKSVAATYRHVDTSDQIELLRSEQKRADIARDADLHPVVDVDGNQRWVLL